MDTVKSRIASFEAQNNQVRFSPVKSPQGDGSPQSSGYDSPNGLYGNPQQPQLTPLDAIGCNSTNPFSPERPLSTTSFASQNRINRLQRQAAAGVGANTSNTSAASTAASTAASSNSSATTDLPVPVPHTKPGLRAPQPPDSQGGSSLAQMRQTARERRLTGAQANPKGGMPSSPAPSASLFAHHRQQPGTSNTARATSPVRDSVNSESIGNSNSNMELKSPPRTGLQSRTLANAKRRTRSNISSTSNGQSNSSSRLETPTPTKIPARTATASTVVSGAVDSDPKDSSMRMREMDRPSEEEKSMARKSRMEKVERIKKKRSLDTVRRRKKPGSSSSSGQHKPAAQQQQQQHASSFAEDPAMMLSPTTVQAVPSVDHATDDEMTLTSVRQIVGNDDYFESPKASVFAEEDLSPKPRGDYGHQSSSRLWMENMEEKSEKDDPVRGIMIAPSSSSEYDTDGDENSRIASALYDEGGVAQDPSLSVVSSSQVTPAEAALLGKNRQKNSRKGTQALGNTTGTFDYGERDEEGSVVSLSYEQRRQKEVKEKEARNAAVAAAKAKMDDGPFVQTEDVEHYRKTLSTPIAKTAMGVAGAATLGCILLGPVGLLVGAAVVGIGIGAMQIPEEQRSHMQDKASETMKSAQESAFNASETFSSSCASKCKDSGVSEHFPSEMESCFGGGGKDETGVSEKNEKLVDELNTYASYQALDPSGPNIMDGRKVPSPSRNGRVRDQKETVACLQEGQIIPVGQIHSLKPSQQPRAWLDVLASAKTSDEEKAEAMEEILILAKDKQRARIFLEEGILDSIMWMIGRYREKVSRNAASDDWAHPEITPQETNAARLAASCCLTLGKSHCAAIHTEGDLLLMSLYERGTVPEERQLAQMLHEIPFHTRATVTDDPTIIEPSQEVFAMKHMSLPQAEELARSITALAAARL